MILDPYGQFIKEITAHCDISDKTILEVGCGHGRITRDLARHARRVVAIDPDEGALQKARTQINAENVVFLRCRGELLPFPEGWFDMVVYSLSLHHLAQDAMRVSFNEAAGLLGEHGLIVVIEPGEDGTLIKAEERFGVGDGNETGEKDAARRAIADLSGWRIGKTVCFQTCFHFVDQQDFLESLLPDYKSKSPSLIRAIGDYLADCTEHGRIVMHADRRMDILLRA
ncbi:MAG: class I SAM-dependent methyltransferase [Desulfurivibrionaceae bacterium]|nr:class I SAM-dependent methyltransferase [Desulfurivibrionaceae bacterium]